MAKQEDIKIPFQFNVTGYPVPVTDNDVFGNILFNILSTSVGERVHRPTFGSFLNRLVFEPVNNATASRASAEIVRAVSTWEPRIQIVGIDYKNTDNSVIIIVKWIANNSTSGTTSVPIQITRTVS